MVPGIFIADSVPNAEFLGAVLFLFVVSVVGDDQLHHDFVLFLAIQSYRFDPRQLLLPQLIQLHIIIQLKKPLPFQSQRLELPDLGMDLVVVVEKIADHHEMKTVQDYIIVVRKHLINARVHNILVLVPIPSNPPLSLFSLFFVPHVVPPYNSNEKIRNKQDFLELYLPG